MAKTLVGPLGTQVSNPTPVSWLVHPEGSWGQVSEKADHVLANVEGEGRGRGKEPVWTRGSHCRQLSQGGNISQGDGSHQKCFYGTL